MFQLLTIALLAVVIAGGVWLYLTLQKYKRGTTISEITSTMNLLAKWTYTPDEWRKAVEDEFTWASSDDSPGQVFISPTAIYVRTNRTDHLIDLVNDGKVLTHASYRGTDGSPLKLRVRWKVVDYDGDDGRQTKYYKEDYRIPVPSGAKDDARNVAEYFTTQQENNLDAYTAVVPDDEPISIFGRDDSF